MASGRACLHFNPSLKINTLEWNLALWVHIKVVNPPHVCRVDFRLFIDKFFKVLWFLHAKFLEGILWCCITSAFMYFSVPPVSCQLVWTRQANILGLCAGEIGLNWVIHTMFELIGLEMLDPCIYWIHCISKDNICKSLVQWKDIWHLFRGITMWTIWIEWNDRVFNQEPITILCKHVSSLLWVCNYD